MICAVGVLEIYSLRAVNVCVASPTRRPTLESTVDPGQHGIQLTYGHAGHRQPSPTMF